MSSESISGSAPRFAIPLLALAACNADGRFDAEIVELAGRGLDDNAIAWEMTDRLVRRAQEVFLPVWEQTRGDDGYVSFELDPLLEDSACPLNTALLWMSPAIGRDLP